VNEVITKDLLKERLLKGGAWALGGKVFSVFAGLIINMFLARMLTPKDFGTYFLLQTIITFSVTFVVLGFDNGIIKFISEAISKGKLGEIKIVYTRIFLIVLVSASIYVLFLNIGIINFLSNLFHSPPILDLKYLIFVWIVFASLQRLTTETFRGMHKIDYATIFGGAIKGGIVYYLLFSVFLIAYYYLNSHYSLFTIVSLILISISLSLIFSVYFLLQQDLFKNIKKISKKFQLKEKFFVSFPMLITNLLLLILSNSDIWIIGIFRNNKEVALYSSAAKLILLVNSSLIVVNSFLPPIISDLYTKNDKKTMEKVVRSSSTFAAIPAILSLVILLTFPGYVLNFIFGEFYSKASLVLIILSLGQLFNVWAGSCGYVLLMTGQQKIMTYIMIVSVLIIIPSGILVAEDLGIVGIAIVYASGKIIQNIVMVLFVKKNIGIWTHVHFKVGNIVRLIKS